jgi:hypothetical protein
VFIFIYIGSSDGELMKIKAEVVELTDRCTNLRAMNEELLSMLEVRNDMNK